MKSQSLEALRTLDPAAAAQEPPARADDTQLQNILAMPRAASVSAGPKGSPHTKRRLAAVAAATVVAGGMAVAAIGPWGTSAAFATWTAAPTELSDEQVALRVDQCPDRPPEPGSGPLEPALLDVRGNYSMVIFANEETVVQCYLETTAEGVVLASTAEAGPAGPSPISSEIATTSHGVTTWSFGPSDGGAIALAYGQATEDVKAIEVTNADGQVITATVEGGWWALWVPGDEPLPETATITDAEGNRTSATIRRSG